MKDLPTTSFTSGYKTQLTKQQRMNFIQKYCKKSLYAGTLANFIIVGSIFLSSFLVYQIFELTASYAIAGILTFLNLIFVTRQMRALENIVHFGSHSNFSKNRGVNDFVTNIFAAWPMLQEIKSYSEFHMAHHGEFGSHVDPCRARLETVGASVANVETNKDVLLLILKWMPSYIKEYYREIKSSGRQFITFTIWHLIVFGLMVLVMSWAFAFYCTFVWGISMFILLPFLRAVAELSEHDYERGETVIETTYNNISLIDRILIHPAGDAWHALHHLYPTVPWWSQSAAHNYLLENDRAYRNALHRGHFFAEKSIETPNNSEEWAHG